MCLIANDILLFRLNEELQRGGGLGHVLWLKLFKKRVTENKNVRFVVTGNTGNHGNRNY